MHAVAGPHVLQFNRSRIYIYLSSGASSCTVCVLGIYCATFRKGMNDVIYADVTGSYFALAVLQCCICTRYYCFYWQF